jgi:hypothetical protein
MAFWFSNEMLHIAFALDRHGDALESSDIYAH